MVGPMEFCGRCGSELGRGVEQGRFCPRCGHESSGNARYPLYADGTAAVTRRRPASVSPDAPAEVTRPRLPVLAPTSPAPVEDDLNRVSAARAGAAPVMGAQWGGPSASRSRSVPASVPVSPGASWRVTVVATSLALLLILVLGILLLL